MTGAGAPRIRGLQEQHKRAVVGARAGAVLKYLETWTEIAGIAGAGQKQHNRLSVGERYGAARAGTGGAGFIPVYN